MRGPIDYIVVGFEGQRFDGSILKAVGDAIDKGIIALVDLAVVARDEYDTVTRLEIADTGDEYAVSFAEQHTVSGGSFDQDDIDEVADLIEKNCAAGLLIIEHLWAKPLKEAIINANGVLLAEGRLHPDAAETLEEE